MSLERMTKDSRELGWRGGEEGECEKILSLYTLFLFVRFEVKKSK